MVLATKIGAMSEKLGIPVGREELIEQGVDVKGFEQVLGVAVQAYIHPYPIPGDMPPIASAGGSEAPRLSRLMHEWHRMFRGVRYGQPEAIEGGNGYRRVEVVIFEVHELVPGDK